ncbi:MAG: DUF72 domain-containing protein [Candidatus Hermodarchaeota archaeon]
MLTIKIGCAGWDYKDWIGPFYPKNLKRPLFLPFYAEYFDIIEVNSSFYNIPSTKAVEIWYNQVPHNFKFIIKVWKEITHKLGDDDLELKISQFFTSLKPLKKKILGFLFQFPPWFKHSIEHENKIKLLLNELPKLEQSKIIFEFRDNSWFDALMFLKFLESSEVIIATTYMPGFNAYYHPNQKNYYIRLIGDRELNVFNRIQRTQEKNVTDLLENVEKLRPMPNIYQIFIIVNNHFAGFAPESVNLLKRRLNLPIRDFSTQKKLSDYI